MSNRKIIPDKDADFNLMQKRLRTAANTNMSKWALDTTWMSNVFNPAATLWDTKYAAYLDPLTRTSVITAEKTASRKVYQPYVSLLMKSLRVNTRLSENDRIELGLEDYDTTPTASEVPTSWPVVVFKPEGVGVLRGDYHDSKTGQRRKQKGIHGAEVRVGIQEHPPTSVEEIQHSEFSTRTPYVKAFDMSMRGKTAYFCFRWENTRGQKGPWSEIISAIIP
jgi:hypothetical protein